jgi:hypothetical protein
MEVTGYAGISDVAEPLELTLRRAVEGVGLSTIWSGLISVD